MSSHDDNHPDDKLTCKTARGAIVIVARKDIKIRTGAYGVIERGGKILLMRSKHHKYFLAGGGQDVGEMLPAAMAREVREETGLIVGVGRYLGVFEEFCYWQDTKQAWHLVAHAYAAIDDGRSAIDESVGCDGEGYPEWVDANLLLAHPERAQSPVTVQILKAYFYGS